MTSESLLDAYISVEDFRSAVHYCWQGREDARTRQRAEGLVADVGLRAGVTSGKHLDPLTALIAQVFIKAGIPRKSIHFSSCVELPGYFRAEKKWDVVVVHEGELIAAVELKSILGSYGNNLNNRTEEAIGNAQDLLAAYGEGLLGQNSRAPWLGYVFVMNRERRSTSPVRLAEPHFKVDPAFHAASYLKRAELLCRRLVQKRLYGGAALVTSDGSGPDAVKEPASDLTYRKFVAGILGRVGEALA
jgi:hypothetical protein